MKFTANGKKEEIIAVPKKILMIISKGINPLVKTGEIKMQEEKALALVSLAQAKKLKKLGFEWE